MKYIDGFRDPAAASAFRAKLEEHGKELSDAGRSVCIMEVCGSHTMAIARFGIRSLLPDCVDLVSGPGCPVCVTPPGYIDAAIELAGRGVIIATFGDMLNVPGSDSSLAEARADGARIEVCYSPLRAVELALENPDSEVVFLAIGFETTIAPVISIVKQAAASYAANVSLLTAFKLVPPALDALLTDPDLAIDAFLCPAHVSAIIGSNAYEPVVKEYGKICIVAGFEPLDIMMGIDRIVELAAAGKVACENQYSRVVTPEGNPIALQLMNDLLEPEDAYWRGVGVIPASGLKLKHAYAPYDAQVKFGISVEPGKEHPGCLCGSVIKGSHKPDQCSFFGKACTPDAPVGPCMVSAEGTCAAYYKYLRTT